LTGAWIFNKSAFKLVSEEEIRLEIEQYLRQNGVKSFPDPHSYWSWATRTLGPKVGKQLADFMERRAKGDVSQADAFYDLLALPQVAKVAASFEYGLLVQIASWVKNHLPHKGTVIEVGCHTGLLTRFYAQARPDLMFVGVDRSEAAIQTAQKITQDQKTGNLKFETLDLLSDGYPEIEPADCVISGRVIGELMSPILRLRISWQDHRFPPTEANLDMPAKQALRNIQRLLNPGGKLLLTERLSSFDRLNRLWLALQVAGFRPGLETITPVSWMEVSGEHNSWFFQAHAETIDEISPLEEQSIAWISRETSAPNGTTRLMLDGILAWQTWQAFPGRKVRLDELLRWPNGEEVHYELGEITPGLRYAYVASNTDVYLLTIFLPQEEAAVTSDLLEYAKRLKLSAARLS
jgi:SAM-dependent methyltransferase